MLREEIASPILDGLYGLTALATGTTARYSFPGEIWLGLLTRLPKADKTAYEDDTYFAELSDPNYCRFRLDAESRVHKGKWIMGDATSGEVKLVGEDKCLPSVIANQAPLIFPENSTPETIVGFGLFRSSERDTYTLPFMHGTLGDPDEDLTVELGAEESAIIREGGFEIIFE